MSDDADDEPKGESTDQSEQQPAEGDQPSAQSDEQPAEQNDQSTEQAEEQPAESGQPADEGEEQPSDSDQPAEQPEEQPAEGDQATTEAEEQATESGQPAEQAEEQPADASANNTRSTHMADTRSYSAGLFLLSLDGEVAVLKDVDVDTIKGEVVTINIGMSMGKGVYEWIKASLDETHLRKNGYVVAADYNYKAKSYRHFRDALITEITIPALDGSSKDTSFFTIKFAPEEISYQAGDDADIKGVVNTKQKKWLTSNFRLRLGDLPCGRVSKIDSFTIKQGTTQDHVGEQRISTKEPTKLEFPNLKVTFSASDVKPWATFFDDFVIKGNNGQDAELSGAIEFLDPSLKEVLGSVDLFQVGIFSLAEDKGEANKDSIKRWTAELYVKRMMLNLAYV
jgi:hypothetical protein